ncbi:hypothetical protein Tco_1037657 [Tanacetum coccineum]
MYPSQVSPPRTLGRNEYVPLAGVSPDTGQYGFCALAGVPPRTPGSNEYVPLAGVPSKNTQAFTCSYQFNPLKLIQMLILALAQSGNETARSEVAVYLNGLRPTKPRIMYLGLMDCATSTRQG